MTKPPTVHLLVAFPYLKVIIPWLKEQDPESISLMIDSGAYSAMRSGIEIDLHEYGEFLLNLDIPQKWIAVQLDVMGNMTKTWENYQESIRLGYPVCPVVMHGVSLDLLDEVVATAQKNKANRIFVGNLGSALGELRLDFLDWLRAKYQDTQWHWLGFAPHDGILSSKPVSVDTASAIYNRKFKTLWLPYLPPKSLDSEQFRKLSRETALSLLRRVRFGPEAYRELCTPQGWRAGRYGAGASLALMVTLSTALWYSDWLKDKAGTIFYQAVNTKPDLESFLKAQQHLAVPGIQSSFRRARSK